MKLSAGNIHRAGLGPPPPKSRSEKLARAGYYSRPATCTAPPNTLPGKCGGGSPHAYDDILKLKGWGATRRRPSPLLPSACPIRDKTATCTGSSSPLYGIFTPIGTTPPTGNSAAPAPPDRRERPTLFNQAYGLRSTYCKPRAATVPLHIPAKNAWRGRTANGTATGESAHAK